MITIFTPTYNRINLLERCYESLKNQSDKNFEWLIVDDGSSDGTKEFVKNIKNSSRFPIKYIYQENGGKHRSFNTAIKNCNSDYFLFLDSDDVLTFDAIDVLNQKCAEIEKNKNISGIIGNRGQINSDKVIGKKIPKVKYASGLYLYQKLNFSGDTLRLYKTSILKKYPFPEIDGEKFMSENVVFDKIDEKYKMLVIQEILYLGEYQEKGLSNNINNIRIKNPVGYSLSLKSTAETAITLKKKIGTTILFVLWNRKFHIKNAFSNFKNKILYIICLPISFIFEIFKIPKFYFNMFK